MVGIVLCYVMAGKAECVSSRDALCDYGLRGAFIVADEILLHVSGVMAVIGGVLWWGGTNRSA